METYGLKTKEQLLYLFELLDEKWEKERLLNPPKQEGDCYFCHKPTTNEDFCYGCEFHICENCIGPAKLVPMGPHTIDAHKASVN